MKPLVLTLHINTTQDVGGFKYQNNLAIQSLAAILRCTWGSCRTGLLLDGLKRFKELKMGLYHAKADHLVHWEVGGGKDAAEYAVMSLLWRYFCPPVNVSSNISFGSIARFVFFACWTSSWFKHHLLRWSSVTSKLATTEQKCSTVPSDQSSAGWTAEQFSCFQRRFNQVSK